MAGPKNSIMSDPAPFIPPTETEKPKKIPQSEWAKLGKSGKYKKEIFPYLEARKEYYRHFLPDGTPIKDTKPTPQDWATASAVIDEITNLQMMIFNHSKGKK